MKLSDREWKPYKLSALGKVESGRDIYALERIEGNIPYITSGSQNNGIGYFVGNKNDTLDKGYIAFNRNGAVGLAFYHPYWSVMGNDCRKIHLSEADENIYVGLFVATTISMQSKSFSYSRKLGTARANKLQIMLPVTDDGEPDYQFMEDYVRELMIAKRKQYRDFVEKRLAELGVDVKIIGGYRESLDSREWKEFFLEDLFIVKAGKRLTNADKVDGDRPFISATDNTNGVTGFVDNENNSLDRNVLGVNYNGAPCIGFYHPYECIFTDDVKRLHLKNYEDNAYVLLFMKSVIMQQCTKYSYGYKFNERRMLRQLLSVPVTETGEPDYEFMEEFGRKMMTNKYSQYLAFLALSDTIKEMKN